MDNIKPCPFCGCEAEAAYNIEWGYQVFCTNDGCFMNLITMYGVKSEQDAIKMWNRRIGDDKE